MDKKNIIVFFDFDKTITLQDTLDHIIEKFSLDRAWEKIEKDWVRGKIGSQECLTRQLERVRLTPGELKSYLKSVKIDASFLPLVKLLKSKRIPAYILTDNFDYIVKRILEYKGIKGLPFYANSLKFEKNKLKLSFPFRKAKCLDCGHCKQKNLLAKSKGKTIIVYIGDGRTDLCAAQEADVVFAKDTLKEFCLKKNLKHIPFKHLKTVHEFFKRSIK